MQFLSEYGLVAFIVGLPILAHALLGLAIRETTVRSKESNWAKCPHCGFTWKPESVK